MNAFDKALHWFSDKFQRDATHRLAPFIEDGGGALKANEHYFRLWLDEMFLKDERAWFTAWHPAVHSAVTFEFGDQTQVVTRIAGASALKDVDDKHLDRVITLSTPLTSTMPFRGGTVRINAALLAMKGQDAVKQLINVLGEISTSLAVPQLSTAINIAKPLAEGVSALVGVTDGEMMLGLDATMAGGDLKSGSYAIVYAAANEIPVADISIKDKHLQVREQPLEGRNYLLLRIERLETRDDWDSLGAIHDPYQEAIDQLTDGELAPAQKALKKAIGAALKSSDLTDSDRRRVIDALRKRYAEAEQLVGGAALGEEINRTLAHLLSLAISPAEAAAAGAISEREAFENLR